MNAKVVATNCQIVFETKGFFRRKKKRRFFVKTLDFQKRNSNVIRSKFKFSDHAKERCFQRGINANEVIKLLSEAKLSNHSIQNIVFHSSYLKRNGVELKSSSCLLVSLENNIVKTCIKIHVSELKHSVVTIEFK